MTIYDKTDHILTILRQTGTLLSWSPRERSLRRIRRSGNTRKTSAGGSHDQADPDDPDTQKTDEELLQEKQSGIDEKAALNQELKALERKNLVELARNTDKIKNMVMDANSLESAVLSLVTAIGCLQRVQWELAGKMADRLNQKLTQEADNL